jgi:uncharacterized protein
MQPTQIEEIFDNYLALMSTSNIEAWSELLAEDAIMEIPYAAAALRMPSRLEGKAAICNYVQAGIVQMEQIAFTNVRKYLTADPNMLWIEFHGEAVISATGRRYSQDYVLRMGFKDGQIAYLCDYFNPLALMSAFGSNAPS